MWRNVVHIYNQKRRILYICRKKGRLCLKMSRYGMEGEDQLPLLPNCMNWSKGATTPTATATNTITNTTINDDHLITPHFPFLHEDPHLLLQPQTLIQEEEEEGEEEEEEEGEEEGEEEMDALKEMQYMMAAMQPVDIDPASVPKPNRRNVRISEDPQTVVARRRRERISEKIRILKRLVPGGAKMDTASMLEEAIRYAKFLKRQVRLLQDSHFAPNSSLNIHPTSHLSSYNNNNNYNFNMINSHSQPPFTFALHPHFH